MNVKRLAEFYRGANELKGDLGNLLLELVTVYAVI